MDDFEGYDCLKCFTDSDCEPLTLEKFDIIDEWVKRVPIHVQLLLESFLNKDYVRRCEKKEIYIQDNIRNLYRIYYSPLHFYNMKYIGVFQERNTEELILNHESLDTVFKITSDSGTTVSLSLADHLVKKKANSELCYCSTVILFACLSFGHDWSVWTTWVHFNGIMFVLFLF